MDNMRIGRNHVAFTALRSKMIRSRKTKIKSSSFSTSSSRKSTGTTTKTLAQKSAALWESNKKNASASKTMLEETKANYTAMKTAAGTVAKHLEKLMTEGEGSLFDKAETEADRESVLKEITGFVEAYNDMVESMTEEGGTVNEMYTRQLHGFVVSNRSKLEKSGITENKNGKLEMNKETAKKAETETLKELFQGKDSFAGKVSERSEKIKENADTNLNSINSATYSALLSSYGSSGSRFNSWG